MKKVKICCDRFYDYYNDKEKKLSYFVSDEDREYEKSCIYTPTYLSFLCSLNIIFNFFGACFCLYLSSFSFIWLPIGFILFDLIFSFIDNLIFHAIPLWQFKNMSYKNRLKEVEKTDVYLKSIYTELEEYNCGSAHCSTKRNCSECNNMKSILEKRKKNVECYLKLLDKYIQEYEDLNQVKLKEEVIFNNLTEKEQITKQNQLKDLLLKLENFNEITGILELKESLNEFFELLNEIPERYTYISRTFFIYLEELLDILGQVNSVEDNLKKGCLNKVTELTKELRLYVTNLKERIISNSLKDVNLNMTVLYQELQKENKKLTKEDDNV